MLKKKDGLSLFDPQNAFETASARERQATGGDGPIDSGGSDAGAGTGGSGNDAKKVGLSHIMVALAGVVCARAWYCGLRSHQIVRAFVEDLILSAI